MTRNRPRSSTIGLLGHFFAEAVGTDIRGLKGRFRRGRKPPPYDEPKDRDREMIDIGILHELLPGRRSEAVPAATWTDLDMDAVYAVVDRCVSPPGEQVLYDILRTPASDEVLRERERLVTHMDTSAAVRDEIRLAMDPLRTTDAYDFPHLYLSDIPARPRFYYLVPLLTLTAISLIVLLFFEPGIALPALLVTMGINLTVQYRFHGRIRHIVRPLTLLNRLLQAGERIGRIDDPGIADYTQRLRAAVASVQGIRGAAKYLAFERQWDDLAGGIYVYINAVLLLDVNAFLFSIETVRRHRDGIRSLHETLGALDAAISIAGYRRAAESWCTPTLEGTGRQMEVEGLVHPLLASAVPNDLSVAGRSVLITGSNMAGKTTFIRALAINAILAATIHTCTATRYRAPQLRVHTMIGRDDNLSRGQSYFAAELELSLAMVRAADESGQHLFAIDELFRGTNTVERVAAARAVLARLATGDHIVIAATHDLELLNLLDERWEFHHFRESVEGGELHFDYRIHPGPTSTHNAIRMMEAFGFPAEVVGDARRVADALSRRNAAES